MRYVMVCILGVFVLSAYGEAWGTPTIKANFFARDAGASNAVSLYHTNGSLFKNSGTQYGGAFHWKDLEVVEGPVPGPFTAGPSPRIDTEFVSFCIEINQSISKGVKTRELIDVEDAPKPGVDPDNPEDGGSPMGPIAAGMMGELWGKYFDTLWTPEGSYTASEKIGAFQLALWELSYDHGVVDFSDGLLQTTATGDVATLAMSWLVDVRDNAYGEANLIALSSDNEQDHLTEVVPEMSSLLLWGTIGGVFVTGCWFRRKRRVPQ